MVIYLEWGKWSYNVSDYVNYFKGTDSAYKWRKWNTKNQLCCPNTQTGFKNVLTFQNSRKTRKLNDVEYY